MIVVLTDELFAVVLEGGGPSPNSAISDMYSSSIFVLSPETAAVAAATPPIPGRLERQSRAMWPAPPQLEQTMLFVTFGLSGHNHDL